MTSLEDKSVRGMIKDIDQRTKGLEPVFEKLSDSLKKIAHSFGGEKAASKFKPESRDSLLSKFQTPVLGGNKSSTDVGTSLKDLGELLTRNHKESFELFKSIDSTLKKIEEKGGTVGSGIEVNVGTPGKKGKAAAKAGAQAAAGGAGRFLSRAVPIAAAGMAAFDAYGGYQEAQENLDIKDREATFGEKLASAGGSAVSGLTFGLLDKKVASKGIASFFGAGEGKGKAPAISTSELEGITAPSQEFDIEAPPPISIKTPEPEIKVQKTSLSPVSTVAAAAPVIKETKPSVTPATKATAAPSTKLSAKGASLKSEMEGDDNLEKLEMAKGELQGLYEDYRDEKRKVTQELINSKKYPEGFIDIKGKPNYPKELEAVDKKYEPLIEAQKKEIEKLSKAPGIKEAKARSDSFDKELEGSEDFDGEPKGKSKGKPTVTSKEKFIETKTETISESGGGYSETKRVRSADAESAQKEMTALEGKQEEERNQVVAKLKAEGKVGKVVKFSDYENIPELKELTAKQEKERSDIQARIDKGTSTQTTQVSAPPSTTTTSSTVGNISQENMDMLQKDVESGKPVVINNTNSMSTSTSSIAPVRTLPRPSNNSFERKQSSVAMF